MNNNKNTLIGILAVIVILLIGSVLYAFNKPAQSPVVDTTPSPTVTTTTGTPSTPVVPVTPAVQASAPEVRTGTTVTTSNSTAAVNGTVKPNGAATTYWYEYGETTALGTRTSNQAIGSGFASIAAPGYITGLKANTQYYFRLSSSNRISTVNGTTYSFKTNTNPAPQGSIPSPRTNDATDITRTSADLHGQVNPNGFDTSYWFEYGETRDLGNVTGIRSASDGKAFVPASVSITNLKPVTKYYFRINVQNQFGTANGSILSFTTAGPAAIVLPTVRTDGATSVSTSTATLNGSITPNGAGTKYWFQYGTDVAMNSPIATISPTDIIAANASTTAVSVNIRDLDDGTRYYFRIVGQNSRGLVEGDVVSFSTRNP